LHTTAKCTHTWFLGSNVGAFACLWILSSSSPSSCCISTPSHSGPLSTHTCIYIYIKLYQLSRSTCNASQNACFATSGLHKMVVFDASPLLRANATIDLWIGQRRPRRDGHIASPLQSWITIKKRQHQRNICCEGVYAVLLFLLFQIFSFFSRGANRCRSAVGPKKWFTMLFAVRSARDTLTSENRIGWLDSS